ncbi:hypothetical protein KEM52_003436, partial [Ascosphaera acerosa]
VPYYLAPLWDAHYAKAAAAKREREREREREGRDKDARQGGDAAVAVRDLRARLKHARAARGMLRDIELEMRGLIEECARARSASAAGEGRSGSNAGSSSDTSSEAEAEADASLASESDASDASDASSAAASSSSATTTTATTTTDDDDDDDSTPLPTSCPAQGRHRSARVHARQRLVLDDDVSDKTASFSYVLHLPRVVHCLAAYYDLHTWSVTSSGRRRAYVSIEGDKRRAGARAGAQTRARTLRRPSREDGPGDDDDGLSASLRAMPQPLWTTL